MLIILAGGSTGGSVSPVLAVAEEIKKQYLKDAFECEFLFIGTRKGLPEKELAQTQGISYRAICSGKLRRYFSFKNFADFFLILLGFFQSLFIILKYKPEAIVSAGGFVAVPLSWAGWFCRVPIFIHQQDVRPGLANKLIAPLARKITVSLPPSVAFFKKNKRVLTGNPVRSWILKGDKPRAIERFNLEQNLPTLLVIGGGTGAYKINEIIGEIVPELSKFCQIIHLTGRSKLSIANAELSISRYHQYDFLDEEIADVYAAADLVVSRAGMGVLTELSVLGKSSIIIPIPGSHQEFNAQYFAEQKAVVLIEEKTMTPPLLLARIRQLVFSPGERSVLSLNISKLASHEAGRRIAEIILNSLK